MADGLVDNDWEEDKYRVENDVEVKHRCVSVDIDVAN